MMRGCGSNGGADNVRKYVLVRFLFLFRFFSRGFESCIGTRRAVIPVSNAPRESPSHFSMSQEKERRWMARSKINERPLLSCQREQRTVSERRRVLVPVSSPRYMRLSPAPLAPHALLRARRRLKPAQQQANFAQSVYVCACRSQRWLYIDMVVSDVG